MQYETTNAARYEKESTNFISISIVHLENVDGPVKHLNSIQTIDLLAYREVKIVLIQL